MTDDMFDVVKERWRDVWQIGDKIQLLANSHKHIGLSTADSDYNPLYFISLL